MRRLLPFLLPALGAACAPGTPPAARDDARILAGDIAFYESRLPGDPYGARDRAVLGGLYLARSRATGSASDLARAETLARASLRLRHGRNTDAARVLVASLMAGHRFLEARAVLWPLGLAAPEDVVTRATLGELALELGHYAEADSLFGGLGLQRMEPAVGARYARWLELSGKSGEARELLEALRERQAGAYRVPASELAWLDLRLGELAMRNGRADLAAAALARGRRLAPADHRLLAASARLAAANEDWPEAVRFADSALALLPEPGTLVVLLQAARAQGDTAAAGEYRRALQATTRGGPAALHRDWALSLLDQQGADSALLAAIAAQHAERHDVYTHDLVAWARYRTGDLAGARLLADSALLRHVRDATLYAHGARIALAAGDRVLARARLREAVAIAPRFPRPAAHAARAFLDSLEAVP